MVYSMSLIPFFMLLLKTRLYAALLRAALPRHIDAGTHAGDVPTTINIEMKRPR